MIKVEARPARDLSADNELPALLEAGSATRGRGANLGYASLSDAAISQTQWDNACGTEAKLNPGLTLKACSN